MKKRVFVIDDEKDIREILRVNLTEAQYLVHSFGSAEEALAELKRTRPDIIILDIMMNGMDGYEFCRTLRGMREFATIPVIFLSARAEELDAVNNPEDESMGTRKVPFSRSTMLLFGLVSKSFSRRCGFWMNADLSKNSALIASLYA